MSVCASNATRTHSGWRPFAKVSSFLFFFCRKYDVVITRVRRRILGDFAPAVWPAEYESVLARLDADFAAIHKIVNEAIGLLARQLAAKQFAATHLHVKSMNHGNVGQPHVCRVHLVSFCRALAAHDIIYGSANVK